ncbi:hypothetical protein OS493_001223 [Desmophyllum pertusum]|uniref:Uncharacterized protein n=1 Tax=Desmophyllum pertusum TaxID=174260 RepID=A0A9W9ZVB6_9CNID|nr:hypothetical protein OS493_001223 [Desmophyllum pertusum]
MQGFIAEFANPSAKNQKSKETEEGCKWRSSDLHSKKLVLQEKQPKTLLLVLRQHDKQNHKKNAVGLQHNKTEELQVTLKDQPLRGLQSRHHRCSLSLVFGK